MNFLREPLVHFLLLGAALFAIFQIAGEFDVEKRGQLVVSTAQVQALVDAFYIDFGHAPNEQERKKAIEDYIREEILVREAEKLGFHRDKQNIRRLMQQHIESANEGDVQLPTDAQLQEFLTRHPELFRKNPTDQVPPFEQIKPAVQNAWITVQRKAVRDAAYEKLKSRYNITIELPKPASTTSTAPSR